MRAALNISLPASMRTWVEEQVKRLGYGTASEYIRQLLREQQKRELQTQIDEKLLKALNSGDPTEMTSEDWKRIRRRVFNQESPRKR